MRTGGRLGGLGCMVTRGTTVTGCRNWRIPFNGYVKIPEGVMIIGDKAFRECKRLTV